MKKAITIFVKGSIELNVEILLDVTGQIGQDILLER